MRRLAETRQGQQLSASMQFDLARSPMDDDELERVVDQFRDSPRPAQGWGLSSVLNEVLSSEPKRIPVDDLKALQKSLIGQGYAPPDADASGVWDPSWYAHFRRFDRDNYEEQRAGKHWYSAPVSSGMRALTNTLPSRVFQGLVGAAKGIVTQAPETAERVGALGGAAAGAGLGTLVAPGLGTVVGAGIGGAVGFIADLFGEDESEEDQSVGGAILDALSPWEEYRDNPKAAWEDLGYVLTAASLVSGVGVAARGVSGGLRAIQATRAPSLGAGRMFAVGAEGAGSTAIGQPLGWAKAAMLPTRSAAQTELGAVGTILRAAVKKKAMLPGTPGKTGVFLQKYSPIAFANRLGPKIALDVFGGTTQAQMGARLFGGLGQGTKTKLLEAQDALKAELGRDLTEDELQNLEKTVATSTIEKSVAEAPRLESGIEVPLLGDMVDLAAFMLYPQRLLPFSGHKAAVNAYKALGGADHLLLGYAHAIQKEKKVGIFDALKQAREQIDPLENTRLRMEFGLHAESHLRVAAAVGGGGGTMAFKRGAIGKARGDAIREIRGELAGGGKGQSDTLKRVMALSEADPTSFEAWLQDLNTAGRGLSRLRDNRSANDVVRRLERQLNTDKAIIAPKEDGSLDLIYLPDTRRVREVKRSRDLDILMVEDQITKLEQKANRLERFAERGALSPELSMTAHNGARLHRMEVDQLKRRLGTLQGVNAKEITDGVRLAPARVDFQDKQTLLAKADDFDALRDEVLNAPTPAMREVARQRLANYVSDLESEGLISEKLVKTALIEKPGKAVGVAIRDNAKSAAARFDVPPEFRREFGVDRLEELGYKLVETGEDVIFPDEIDSMLEITGVGQYTKRAAVMESLGFSLLRREDESIGELMALHKRAEVGEALSKHKIALSPQAAMKRLHGHIDEINHGKYSGATLGPLRKGKTGKLGMYKVDTRDLSAEEIFTAFEDVPGFTPEAAADVYGALRKGSAMGSELKLLSPGDTFRELGRAMRINGAPGFSDLLRTYHAEVPDRLNRQAWRHGEMRYKPETELARSPQRKRFEVTAKEVADRANVTEGQRNLGMALMDSVARAQVKLGRFESVDDFYGHVDARFAEKYVQPGSAEGAQLQIQRMVDSAEGEYAKAQLGEDLAQGLTEHGPDFVTTMRFFRDADFSTLARENAHLLRRLVSDEDMAILGKAYGVKSGKWTRKAEDAFAKDAEKYILSKLAPGHSRGAFDAVREGLGALWSSMRPAAVETNLVPRSARQVMDKHFGDALALSPETRTLRGLKDVKSKQVLGGAAVGGVAGGIEGEGIDGDAILNGALYGAAGGLIGRQALKRTHGYLPDALARMNTALRYTLSLTFDAGRISEQNLIAMAKYNLRPMWSPRKTMMGHADGWKSPYTAGKVNGEAAWRDVTRYWDEINGTNHFVEIDDLGRRMFQRGMLGFSPREWEAAQAFQLYQRGWGSEQVREAVTQIGRYGTGRTAAEKTANFVVFPFSFSKKLLTTLGDFVLQHPGRNLLIHEGLRRYQESEYDDKAQDFLKKHLPLLEELKGINNLAFGLSPGRFFLAGLADHRTGTGKAAQLMSSFFVPSGAATTLAQAAGNVGDLAINAFTPVVITGESINRAGGIEGLDDIMRRYIPFMRELDTYFLGRDGDPGAFSRQLTALMEGADPYYQFSAYQDELRTAKAEHEPLALAMGYSSVDGLLQSDIGQPVSDMIESQRLALNEKYPTGFRMSQEFTNKDAIDEQALVDLAKKPNRTAGEDHILEVLQHINQQKYLGEIVGLDPQMVGTMVAQSARSLGEKYGSDTRFLELWDRFMLREYGPLRRVA